MIESAWLSANQRPEKVGQPLNCAEWWFHHWLLPLEIYLIANYSECSHNAHVSDHTCSRSNACQCSAPPGRKTEMTACYIRLELKHGKWKQSKLKKLIVDRIFWASKWKITELIEYLVNAKLMNWQHKSLTSWSANFLLDPQPRFEQELKWLNYKLKWLKVAFSKGILQHMFFPYSKYT
jgi:hypothetical protein